MKNILALSALCVLAYAAPAFSQEAQSLVVSLPYPQAVETLSIEGDDLYAVSKSGSSTFNKVTTYYGGIYRINKITNKIVWHFDPNRTGLPSLVTKPLFYKDTVILNSYGGIIYILDKESGKLKSQIDINQQTGTPSSTYKNYMTPIIQDDIYYHANDRIVAIDLKTNRVLWINKESVVNYDVIWYNNTNMMNAHMETSDVAVMLHEGILYYPCQKALCAVDAKTGKSLWRKNTIENFKDNRYTILANAQIDLDGQLVMLSAEPFGLIKLNPKTGATIMARPLEVTNPKFYYSGFSDLKLVDNKYVTVARTGEVITIDRNTFVVSVKQYSRGEYTTPTQMNDSIMAMDHAFNQKSQVFMVNSKNGSVQNMWQLNLPVGHIGSGNLVVDGTNVYLGTSAGQIIKIDTLK